MTAQTAGTCTEDGQYIIEEVSILQTKPACKCTASSSTSLESSKIYETDTSFHKNTSE
jgi:hypothetical protein